MSADAATAPSGVVTFLFTDIEGSTRRWEADAQAMRSALVAHDTLLRTVIEAHGGYLFSHTGDGVVAAFTSPKSAVNAAIDAQRALELPVRMGIATGEAERRDGDYFGTVLNRAARLMAAGHGGQILVADSTASLLSDVDLVELGPRRLRDVPMPIGVFQVQADGLRAEFPPLRALEMTPGNLRQATTSLIGRDAEVSNIQAAVKEHRLVTLTGVGGIGKTRLAMEVAARLADEFPDGVWLFELATVTDPAAVPDAVAAVLGITQQPGKTVSESLADALEGRVRLLVIDNCEHVLGAAADLIEAILAHSDAVRILATSREGLGVPDEQVRPVRSLDASAGIDSAAVSLFVERAQGIAADFSMVDDDDSAAVTEICQRLDGIPLAIELAASRMASMTVSEMRDRLDRRFRLLVGSRRGLERHHTLRHAVAWSYDLLADPEKRVLERCSVFAGGFDLESACAVAGYENTDDYAVLEVLDALVRKSLLLAVRSGRRTRYSMLETIRQFAEDQLVAGGAADVARDAHARHFAGREADILALWDSPRQRETYDWFTNELANLRAAFRWAADHDDLDVASTLGTYVPFVGLWANNYEPIAWAEELIEPASAVGHPRLGFLYLMAVQCWMPGRIEAAVRYADAAQTVIGSGRHDELPFGLEGLLGVAYMAIGHSERWVEWCRAQLTRDRDSHIFTRACLVSALTFSGCGEDAKAVASGLVDVVEAGHNPFALALALHAYGLAFRESDPAGALAALRRCLVVARDSGNRWTESMMTATLSRVEAAHGTPLAALDYLAGSISNFHDAGSTSMVGATLAFLGALFDRLGRYESAAVITGFARSPFTVEAMPEFGAATSHLRDVLGEQTYESLAGQGEAMTVAEMVTYAYDQIDRTRAELNGAG